VAKVVSFAEERGYHFSLEEAKEYLEAKSGVELDDAQLDTVAGGKGPSHSPPSSTATTNVNVLTTNVVVTIDGMTQVVAVTQVTATAVIVLT
jgi:hypothetical protein